MLFPLSKKDLCQTLSFRDKQSKKKKRQCCLLKRHFPTWQKDLFQNKQKRLQYSGGGEGDPQIRNCVILHFRTNILRASKQPLQRKLFFEKWKKKRCNSKELNLWDILTCLTAHKRRGKHTGYYSKILQSINYVSGKNHTLPLSFGFQPTY